MTSCQGYTQFEDELAILLNAFNDPLDGFLDRKLTLILHAGTPKTGTTSLQTYLRKKQRKLRSKGVLYPHNLDALQNPTAPQHQWFEKNLVAGNTHNFLENFKNIMSQVKTDTHTIILSSEGIYNYWWDMPSTSKQLLSCLDRLFDVHVWVWFREPLSFIESFYKQCIRNPQIDNNPCYGKDMSFNQMLSIDWFSKHLNYQGFVRDCQHIFGHTHVYAFEYQGDVVQTVIKILGLATPHDNPTPRQNQSLNSVSIELLRVINRTAMTAKAKESLMPHLRDINYIMAKYSNTTLIDDKAKDRVLEMSRPVKFRDIDAKSTIPTKSTYK